MFRQSRPPKAAEAIASRIARPATTTARRTKLGRACELVSATIEVALVLSVSSTAAQPLLFEHRGEHVGGEDEDQDQAEGVADLLRALLPAVLRGRVGSPGLHPGSFGRTRAFPALERAVAGRLLIGVNSSMVFNSSRM